MSQSYQMQQIRVSPIDTQNFFIPNGMSPLERRSLTYHQSVKQFIGFNYLINSPTMVQPQQITKSPYCPKDITQQIQNQLNQNIISEKIEIKPLKLDESLQPRKTQKILRNQSIQTQFLLSDLPKILFSKSNEEQLKQKIIYLEKEIENMKKQHFQEISTLKCLMSNSFLEETNSQTEHYFDSRKSDIQADPSKLGDFDKQIIELLKELDDSEEIIINSQDDILQQIQNIINQVKHLENEVEDWKISYWNLQKDQSNSLNMLKFDDQIDFPSTKKKGELILKLKQQGMLQSELCIPEVENDSESILVL